MVNLTATFRLIDDISDKLDAIASRGDGMVDQFESVERVADSAFDGIKTESAHAAQSIDGVAQSASSASQQVSEMGDDLSEAADATAKVSEETERLGDKTEEYGDKSEEAGGKGVDAMQTLADAIQTLGIAKMLEEIVDAFGACSDAAAEVETVAAKVATIADTSQASISQISNEVLALSNDTGQAAAGLMDSVYNAISAGVQTADAVAFVEQSNRLAVGGFTSATTAVDVLTTALNAYGLEVDQVSKISDYLITTQNLGKTTVDELAQSVGKVIPLAAAYGVEMDNLSTAYAVMTANGIATAEAGTYIKSMLSELGDTGSDVAGILEEQTGMSFAELTEQGYSLGDILEILGDAAGGSATEFANLWSSTEAGVGALSLFNSGAERYNAVLGQMATSAGATEAAYNTMMNTTEAAHQRLDSAVTNLSASIGNALNPALTKLYNGLADVVGGISEFLAEHPLVAKAITAFVVGITGATTALLGFMVIKTAIPLVTAFGVALNTALGPIGWVALGITAVVSAGAAFIAMLGDAEDETENLSDAVDTQAEEMELLEAQYEAACEMYGETSDEALRLKEQMDELSESIEGNGESLEDSTEAITTWEDAATAAFSDVEGEVQALIQAYADAYNAALESFDGQFALFEEASMASEEYLNSNVENAQKALDSQLAYWQTYTANIEVLAQTSAEQLGVTQANYDALMSYVRDGSVEAAGLAASMVENINSGNTQAITNLANTIGQVAEQRQAAANATAEWVTDFNNKMEELTDSMERTIDELDLDAEAAAAAQSTIQAYADTILANKSAAVSAANQVKYAVEEALNSTNININYGSSWNFPGYATGTTDAEDIFMAGEEGPELIVGHEGATVFPASETDRIINAVNGTDGVVSVAFADELVAAMERYSSSRYTTSGTVLAAPEGVHDTPTSNSSQPQEKIIRVEINGSGSVGLGSGTSKQEVVDLMFDNLRPVLMSIVEEELFEEGDATYDF